MQTTPKAVPAIYQSIEHPIAYANNPLIEALPPIFSPEELLKLFQHRPATDLAAEINLPIHERVHCVSALDDLIIPLPSAFDVESDLSIMLRRGYATRNPMDAAWLRERASIYDEMSRPIREYQTCGESVSSMMITGVSGCGKTTLTQRLLRLYPQVIQHKQYRNTQFDAVQIVWIAVSASFDASLKGLVLSLFSAIDSAAGTNYRSQYERSKLSIDSLLGNLAKVFLRHNLGVILIDECQCLLLRGKEEAQLALNLFLKISNVCRIPLLFVGTYAASALFATVARNARRVCSGGYTDMELPKQWDDPVWYRFVLSPIWEHYQWVPRKKPLDETIAKLYFDLTQGIIAVLIALHRAAQIYAIRNGLETVDVQVIRTVYERQFVLLHPALDALRSGKANRLEKFEDLLPPKAQLESLLKPTCQDILEERLALLQKAKEEMYGATSD